MEIAKLPRGKCAYCGKEIPVPSIRDNKARYCGKVHASLARFKTRYRGSMSGPADRPSFDPLTGERISK